MNNIKQFLLAIYVSLALTYHQGHDVLAAAATRDIIFPKISKWQVMVVNGLTTGETLFIHCKSKEDEINLRFRDIFSWNFGENMLHSTLFWCYMSKDDGHMNVNVFWDDVILFHRCGWKSCVWTVKNDGVYLWNSVINEDMLSEQWEVGW